MKYICENCKKEHNGSYGSGRFCSSKCARGFSTKAKRSLINEKVSKKLRQNSHEDVKKICSECGKIFLIHWNKRNQEVCSRSCSRLKLSKNEEYIKKLSISSIEAHKSGKMNVSKKSIRCNYNFKQKNIRCDSKVEYVCLDYFNHNYTVLNIDRCNFFIEYKHDNKIKRYLPDFKIETSVGIFIVECKSFFKITDEVLKSRSWSNYYNTIDAKKEALKKYCNNNGYIDLFFTKDLHRKFYDSLNRNCLTLS